MKSRPSMDSLSQFSLESNASADGKETPLYIAAGDIRRRLMENLTVPKKKFEVRWLIDWLINILIALDLLIG